MEVVASPMHTLEPLDLDLCSWGSAEFLLVVCGASWESLKEFPQGVCTVNVVLLLLMAVVETWPGNWITLTKVRGIEVEVSAAY